MSLHKEQNLISTLRNNKNLQIIQVITTNQNFEKRFNGSISHFFRSLKNGLYSYQGVSNREYFKGISGVYFSLEDRELFEIIIVNDTSYKTLNKIQVITRLKKLLGFDIQVNLGIFDEYEPRIREMIGIKQRTQTFGDYYIKNKRM
jgi:hypothetical protein